REDAVGAEAKGRERAVGVDGDIAAIAAAATGLREGETDTDIRCGDVESELVDVMREARIDIAGRAATAADALREDRGRALAGRGDVAGLIDDDRTAIARSTARAADADPAKDADIAVAAGATAAADRLREDAVS